MSENKELREAVVEHVKVLGRMIADNQNALSLLEAGTLQHGEREFDGSGLIDTTPRAIAQFKRSNEALARAIEQIEKRFGLDSRG